MHPINNPPPVSGAAPALRNPSSFLSVSSLPLILPMSPHPSFNATPVAREEVVTLTVTSGSSTPTSQSSSRGGSASVPIAAIAGGAAGGVTLAVLFVLVWKYWGLVIKRDERKKRKEAVRPIVAGGGGGLTVSCSKIYSPCARTPGGTRRPDSSPNRSTVPCSRSTPTAAR
jgi:hypothetical protein